MTHTGKAARRAFGAMARTVIARPWMVLPIAGALALSACVTAPSETAGTSDMTQVTPEIEQLSDGFLRLSLEAGTHEDGYVDAYFGPADLQAAARANTRDRAQLATDARGAIGRIDRLLAQPAVTGNDSSLYSTRRRLIALRGLYVAAETRLKMMGGEKFSFGNEAQGLFATRPQLEPLSHYDAILARLDQLVPGEGTLAARVDAFNDRYVIPTDRLRPVFDAAIAECRSRTMQHFTLPAGESFTLAFVTNKPWSGYNYYQGNFHSKIEVNTDLPIRISRAVDLGCHEGYPGHHVMNALIEQEMVNRHGWREYQVYPLYSPTSLIAEGSANYGIDLAFPATERLAFERDVLYPLAGLDPATAERYWQVQQATEALGGARLTIAKMYLDGEITRPRAVELVQRYQLLSPARAEQSVGFTDHYRSYVINYGWGKDLVRRYVEHGNPDAATRWQRMHRLLSAPVQPDEMINPR
jgi:hypothetical protein